MSKIISKQKRNYQQKGKIAAVLVLILMLGLTVSRIRDAILLKQETNEAAITLVKTIPAKKLSGYEKILLPGTVSAWHEALIFARTHGYIKKWYVDIGRHVKSGELLALIETPELDAQLRQAEAELRVAIANNKLAQRTAVRWKNLVKTDSVSKQETDEKVDSAAAMSASVHAAQASRDRLRELVGFERVIAPFSGIIADRSIDYGDLVNSGSSPDEAKPLFRLVQTDPLRLYVKIPQTYSNRIRPNMEVSLQFSEHPGLRFSARLLETARAIDPITRTLLAQFLVENKKGILLPGGYTEVEFSMPYYPETVRLPVSTLIFRKEGLQVATLDKDSRVILKNITVYRNFGVHVEITSGIKPGEQIINDPPDSLHNLEKVRVVN